MSIFQKYAFLFCWRPNWGFSGGLIVVLLTVSLRRKAMAKCLCVTNVTGLLLACYVVVFSFKHQCFLVFNKRSGKQGLTICYFKQNYCHAWHTRFSLKVCRLLSSPVLLRKFTNANCVSLFAMKLVDNLLVSDKSRSSCQTDISSKHLLKH